MSEVITPPTIDDRINEIINKYKVTAKDQAKFDAIVPDLKALIETHGLLSYKVATEGVHRITSESGCERGMYKDFIFLKADTVVSKESRGKINSVVRPKKATKTTEQFLMSYADIQASVQSYAPLEQFYFRSKYGKEKNLLELMLKENRPFKESELNTLCSGEDSQYEMSKYFLDYCYGEYIVNGWFTCVDSIDGETAYTLRAIEWDGVTPPNDGKPDYKTWSNQK